jgi:hypothetical protein
VHNTRQIGALPSAMVVHIPWHSAKTGISRVSVDERHGKPNFKKNKLCRVLKIRHTATFESMSSVVQQGTRQNIFIKKIKKSLSCVILLGTRQTLRYSFVVRHGCFFCREPSNTRQSFAECPKNSTRLPAVF